MDEQIKQIAERLRGLRDALELSPEEVAKACQLSTEEYLQMESGTVDISVSVLHQIAQTYGVELTTLMFGDEPKMSSYFVTRKNKGVAVERVKAYKYQSLAAGFAHRKGNPFLVTVHPKPEGTPIYRNTHPGQEFNYVESGSMEIHIDGKKIILEEGDTIMFDACHPHGMRAVGDRQLRFIAIII